MSDIKTHCPKCKAPLKEKPNMFYLHEAGMMPGLVCEPCNALFNSKEFEAAIQARIDKSRSNL